MSRGAVTVFAGAALTAAAASAYFMSAAVASPPRGISGWCGMAIVFGLLASFGGVCGFAAVRGRRVRLRLYAEGFEIGGGRHASRVAWDDVVALWRLERRSSIAWSVAAITGYAIDTASGRRVFVARVFGVGIRRLEDRVRARGIWPVQRERPSLPAIARRD
jgi:hypothetical protein